MTATHTRAFLLIPSSALRGSRYVAHTVRPEGVLVTTSAAVDLASRVLDRTLIPRSSRE